jgi:hypothetical protein
MTQTPQCFRCKHYHDKALEAGEPMTCTAFPDAIPVEIVFNEFDHRGPHPLEANPVRFEPRDDVPAAQLKALLRLLDSL